MQIQEYLLARNSIDVAADKLYKLDVKHRFQLRSFKSVRK